MLERAWIATLLMLVATLSVFGRFLDWVEARPGVRLHDPLLDVLPSADLTWPIFILIYGGIVGACVSMAREPPALRRAVFAYVIMVLLRMICMSVVPLDPPQGMIPLVDPVALVATKTVLTRDLFFSGHTSTLVLCALAVRPRLHRAALATASVVVAVGLLVQHVHYTMDVLVAPMAAFVALRLSSDILGHAESTQ